jgi:hypothetical protein
MNATKLKTEQVMDFIKDFFGIKKMYLLREHLVLLVKVHIYILKESIVDQML